MVLKKWHSTTDGATPSHALCAEKGNVVKSHRVAFMPSCSKIISHKQAESLGDQLNSLYGSSAPLGWWKGGGHSRMRIKLINEEQPKQSTMKEQKLYCQRIKCCYRNINLGLIILFKIPATNRILLPINYYSHYFKNILKINTFYNYLPIIVL